MSPFDAVMTSTSAKLMRESTAFKSSIPAKMPVADGTPLVIAVGAEGARELILPQIRSRGYVARRTMRGLSRERLQRMRTIRRFDRMAEPGVWGQRIFREHLSTRFGRRSKPAGHRFEALTVKKVAEALDVAFRQIGREEACFSRVNPYRQRPSNRPV